MKKNLAKKVTLSILAGAVLMSSSVAWADEAPPTGWKEASGRSSWYVPESGTQGSIGSGDYNDKNFAGLFNETGVAQYGVITISGGSFGKDIDIDICGGRTGIPGKSDNSEAINNAVNISNGNFCGNIYGGYSLHGNATNNSVVISGGKFSSNSGKGSDICGGWAKNDATDNSVTISGGTFGGKNDSGRERIVNIIGGFSYDHDIYKKSKKNTVSISGDANLTYAKLYGGLDSGDDVKYGGADTPNTLNIGINEALLKELDPADEGGNRKYGLQVGAWSGEGTGKVKSIQGFDVINFAYVNWEKDGTVVEVTDNLGLDKTKIKVGTVNVAGGTTLANGDKMALISVTGNGVIDGNISNNGQQVVINKGVAEKYNGYVEKVDNDRKIYLKLGDGPEEGYTVPTGGSGTTPGNPNPEDNPAENPENKPTEDPENKPTASRNDQVLVLGESRAAAVAFTNQGSELIETGLNALARDNEKDTKVFAAVYGNHSEYETGSHVNVNGWSGIVGIGKTNANGLTVGAFFENGEGNYSTHNIFTNDYIRGDGEACYNGGGFLVRKDNANGVYTEASLRAGNLQNELRNAVRNGSELTGYDIDTFYYGAHVGIGKVIHRGNDGDSIDVYGKFIYTHHDGETFDIGGTATKFDSVESERLRLGFRINEVQTNKLSMYYGAAWEYEFNGDAHDKIASFDLETPSLEGSTVIGEIGAHYKASEKWSIDLNGRAYVGQREGFSGSVQANYSF